MIDHIPLTVYAVAMFVKMTYQSIEMLSAHSFTQPVDQGKGD